MLDFLGIGARKAATTWVFKKLCMHPETYFPLGKEAHYWNNYDKCGGKVGDSSWRSLTRKPTAYELKFRPNMTFANQKGFKCGEITPAYATIESRVIEQVHLFSPSCKVFYVIRNPIDCAWSSIKHNFRLSKRDISSITKKDFISLLEDDLTMQHYDYVANIKRWKAYFEDLLILNYDNISNDPRGFLKSLSQHIGISPSFYDRIPLDLLSDVVHTSKGGGVPDDLFDVARDHYKDSIHQLQELMDDDISSWIVANN